MAFWGKLMGAITTGWRAGVEAYRFGPVAPEFANIQAEYNIRWALYTGELFDSLLRKAEFGADTEIYRNTKLLWKHHEAVVDFYAGVIYYGALSTDGQPLPDGVPNAIPFVEQTGDDERDQLLRMAYSELFSAWNWQQQMSLRPMYAAALGDCLTELIDDTERRFVYPQVVWPGYVRDIEIDYVGNVRSYVLEYRVTEKQADGTDGDTYMFRKEVDKEAFRFYRDDKLVQSYANVYGFVPAIWDRHRIGAPGRVRGKAATDGTRQALLQLNSLFGHALDFQHRAFWVPIMVAGAPVPKRHGTDEPQVNMAAPPNGTSFAELFRWRAVPAGAQLLQPTFDVGKTLDMIRDIREGILAENPEASFYQQLREMQQVTAPGAERLMGDVKNRVDLVRAGMDPNTVKLFQMAISMCGMRAHDTSRDGWLRPGARLDRRRMVFVPFDLQSYDRGELDMVIRPRPIVLPTEMERMEAERVKVEIAAAKERLMLASSFEELGYPRASAGDDGGRVVTAEDMAAERQAAFERTMNAGGFGEDYQG